MNLPVPPEQLKRRLIEEGLISAEQFDALEQDAARKNQSLIDVLISSKIVTEAFVQGVMAKLLGVEMANLGARTLDPAIVRLLSEDIARQREAIVFSRETSGTLDVAFADPSNLESIEFLRQRLGAPIKPFLATHDDLSRGFSVYGFKSTEDFKRSIQENIQASLVAKGKHGEEVAEEVPIVAIVDSVLSYALSLRASDVHFEILDDATMIRYRIDGILYEIMRVPKEVHDALVARIKILSGLKIDEHYKPQDGRFRYEAGTDVVDVRVAAMPTYYGEKIVMRLLEATQKPLSLEELGMLPEMAKQMTDALQKTYGMVLSCGPTGSGKSTTLYALMNILNKTNVNIVTIEDPIEYNMRYVNQTQINPQAGITFASGLRAILRQDPNIIMVGEIRDAETADISVQASLTGHLLLSSLHTSDAATAVPRLFDLGVQPFLVSSVLNVILAQRLVRRICPSCIHSVEMTKDLIALIERQLAALPIHSEKTVIPKVAYSGAGCAVCGGTGYRGRFGIFEMIVLNEDMKRAIIEPQFHLENFRAIAAKNNAISMFEDGLRKIELGLTTIEEVLRVISE